ncbi:MAG: response regulator, partial [Anaerolineae bacterium]|nr:response regulator [Anaerolineae bacterium]
MSLILIAHHDKDTRLTLRQLFKQEGYRVMESEDGEQCIAACQTWPIDMVLLDAALPLLDGFETCQRLRTVPRCLTLPLLMIVPDDMDAIDRAFTAGADDCIVEPLHWTMLRKRIARMAGWQKAIQSDQVAWYRSLFEESREGIFRSTTDGRLLEVNMALVMMLGYTTKEELYALRLPDDLYMNPSDRRHLRESYDAAGIVRNAELRWKKRDGTPIWVNLNAIATRDESGEIRHYEGMVTEITESLRIEETLRAIVEGTAAVTGSDYYRLLVQYLATVLGASYAFVGELVTPDDVQTLAFWSKGEHRRNFRYTLAGTPCRTVVDREMAYYPRNVQALFPDDIGLVNMNVESYLGIPLFDAAGKPLGLLVVMHDEELDTLIQIKPILEIFAARTSTEIERQRAQTALQYRVDFEAIVNSISTMFINLPLVEIDRGIQTLLQTAGEYISADRGYVFLYDDPARTSLDNPYEWCARGIEPRTPWLKNFPHQNFRWFDSQLAQREPFTIHAVDLPPEACIEARALELHHVQFGIYVPLIYGEDILGFLGFDSIRLYQPWPDDIGSLLSIAGEILTNALRRKQAEETERQQRLLTEAITSSAIQLNRSLDLEAVLDGILEQVSRVVAYDIADVALIEDGMYR